ncbi:MAG: 4a-hydroxytetrahydrobiopterin dehydratase [Alphaproteobacteria bacterium]|nr:4a-hydroxytetrahydrobiopterin dehydratase [Alphaproteobacteria bacterium]RCL80975.1 MAG: 4a-hydroxytetrahydrobiopterin dehydratase [Alphaproteobacteria bacterium]|tara:strand:+ start:7125 stop:7418 length:294 start_codon:yes stop_codon:yes gene_type:complete
MKLNQKQIEHKFKDLEGWILNKNIQLISKSYKFNDFKEAFLWMTYISEEAERLNHHPEWKNVYNTVEIILTTHDVSGLSNKDFLLANFMDKEFQKFL